MKPTLIGMGGMVISLPKQGHRTDDGEGVAACLQRVGDILRAFVPAPPATDRTFWTSIDQAIAKDLIADGEAALETPYPLLTAHDYRAFVAMGDRVTFENHYFARRTRLNAVVLAEAVEGQGRFTDAIIDGLLLICEESGWQLPAHNAQERNGRRDALPDPDRPVIDLFAAETGAQLAVITTLLGDMLDRADPQIVARVDREIELRITRPYLNRHFWWMGSGDEPMNNWTAWCTQNVLLSTFVRPSSQAVRHAVLGKTATSLDAFLKDYAEDGACDEGALYYRHAALCLFGALMVMDRVAPDAFSALWQSPKIANMADYIRQVHVSGHYYINFADASAVLEPCGAREFLFGKATGSEALTTFAAADFRADPRPDRPEEMNLFYRLLALVSAPDIAACALQTQQPNNLYYPSCGLFVARDDRFVIAAKAGDNADGHNHNDVGSVTVYRDGQPVLIDVGVETYTAKTFSAQRYDIWTMQSAFHNLPTFDGVQQQAGEAFAARDVAVKFDDEFAVIEMEIAGAYPPPAGVQSYWRTVRLNKHQGVEITDHYVGTGSALLSLMVSSRPALSGQTLTLDNGASIKIAGAGDMLIEPIAITDPRLRRAWPEQIYRVLVPFAGHELRLEVS